MHVVMTGFMVRVHDYTYTYTRCVENLVNHAAHQIHYAATIPPTALQLFCYRAWSLLCTTLDADAVRFLRKARAHRA